MEITGTCQATSLPSWAAAQSVAEPWSLLRSTISTLWPRAAMHAARLVDVVVFVVPPFWLSTEIIFGMAGFLVMGLSVNERKNRNKRTKEQ
ncbi:hypothetical protein D3C72_2267630 [compost metagenome]